MDDDFFSGDNSPTPEQPTYQPPQQEAFQQETDPNTHNNDGPTLDFGSYPTEPQSSAQDEDFNDFEEDEMTRRIREEEQRIQNSLRQKSEQEWEDKQTRRAQGRRQLEEYQARKEQEKRQRAEENLRKEEALKEELKQLNVEAGWKKVASNVNLRQGEHKGPRDINRMREAILHRRQDNQ